MTLSVIICTCRRPEEVRALLATLRLQTRPPDEVLVVDASPDTDTQRVVAAHLATWPQATVRHVRAVPGRRGLTRQRNDGLRAAAGDVAVFLDDDTRPEPTFLAELAACYARHPDAAGVGGFITDGGLAWTRTAGVAAAGVRWGCWTRPAEPRWHLLARLDLGTVLPPGWMPQAGHGRSAAAYPPDGRDYCVESLVGAAFSFRRDRIAGVTFAEDLPGYGLYEDLDFCLRIAGCGPLYLCTAARVSHRPAPAGRPGAFRYGRLVVRNGWRVWRLRWPRPRPGARFAWWVVTGLLAGCRLGQAVRGPARMTALLDAAGRAWGAVETVIAHCFRPRHQQSTSASAR